MDKILVNIFVPIINSSYDMFIPVSLKVYTRCRTEDLLPTKTMCFVFAGTVLL